MDQLLLDLAAATDEYSDSPAQNGRILGPVVGQVVRVDASGASVEYPGGIDGAILARSTMPVSFAHVGREALLLFENGDLTRPIIVGLLQPPEAHAASAELDGERIVLTAEREIALRCGAASLTLTRDGKVLIRGASVLSRSSGPNRIKGATVEIN